MTRRFSDQPINVIRRIPTPEQLSAAAGPPKHSFGQAIIEAGAGCFRGVAETIARIFRSKASGQTGNECSVGAPDDPAEAREEEALASEVTVRRPPTQRSAESVTVEREVTERAVTAVQPDEIAELRAFLLTQQQDIARLSAQIHELKSLVVSQQQVLVYLGQELECNTLSITSGIASAPGKRNRPVRERSGKDKTPRKEGSTPSSLSF